ncbi:hypothetical protein HanPSC8_Chr08g0314791 [Helianthus annuus]|nr:hypothetical protein HanPSC8_Chr08g0314791 [Helianthus annuus]
MASLKIAKPANNLGASNFEELIASRKLGIFEISNASLEPGKLENNIKAFIFEESLSTMKIKKPVKEVAKPSAPKPHASKATPKKPEQLREPKKKTSDVKSSAKPKK